MIAATEVFGWASGIVSLIGFPLYVRDILRGTTKPERASWFIWSVLALIAFFSQRAQGATDSLWFTGVQSGYVILIFLLSLWRGVGGWTKRDFLGLLAAGLGLAIWYFTKQPLPALLLVIAVDAVATYLTVPKAYADPESETLISWQADFVAAILGICAVGSFSLALLAYPAYLAVSNLLVTAAILLGRRRLGTPQS